MQQPSAVDRGMTEGISDQKYEIPNMKNLYVFADMHIPMAPWRSAMQCLQPPGNGSGEYHLI